MLESHSSVKSCRSMALREMSMDVHQARHAFGRSCSCAVKA